MSRLTNNALAWLAMGERCAASDTLFTYTTGVDELHAQQPAAPANAAEFRNCRLLLEACPELRPQLRGLSSISREWAEFAHFWDDVCLIQDLEDPEWRARSSKTKRTNAMISRINSKPIKVTIKEAKE